MSSNELRVNGPLLFWVIVGVTMMCVIGVLGERFSAGPDTTDCIFQEHKYTKAECAPYLEQP